MLACRSEISLRNSSFEIVFRLTYRASILIILLNNDAIVRDRGNRDVLEGHIGNRTSGARDSLDTDAVLGIGDSGGADCDTCKISNSVLSRAEK